jgi:hypothetical protein
VRHNREGRQRHSGKKNDEVDLIDPYPPHRSLNIREFIGEDMPLEAVQMVLVYGFLRIGGIAYMGRNTISLEALWSSVDRKFRETPHKKADFDRIIKRLTRLGVVSTPPSSKRGVAIASRAAHDVQGESIRKTCIDFKRRLKTRLGK